MRAMTSITAVVEYCVLDTSMATGRGVTNKHTGIDGKGGYDDNCN